MVIAWIQNWVIHSLLNGNILKLFDANIYFPYHNTFAYSETFITSSLISLPIRLFINQPIVTVNFTFITAIIGLGYSIYCFSYYLTKNYLISIFVGMMLIFSPAVLNFSTHLQMLDIGGCVFSLLFFLIFLDSKKKKYLLLSLILFLLQVYNSFLPGYFILFSYIIMFIFKWHAEKKFIKRVVTKESICFFIVTFLLIIPIGIPYFQVSHEFNYVRDIRDSIHFAFQPEDFLYPGDTTSLHDSLMRLPTNRYSQNNEFKPGYLGVIFSFLTILTIVIIFRNWKKVSWKEKSFLSISLLGFILGLGPFLHLNRHTIHHPFPIPLPYALFYYTIPGFAGMRNSARWEMLFMLAITILIAIVLNSLLMKVPKKKKIFIYLILFLGFLGEYKFPMEFLPVPQRSTFPAVYSWMNSTPSTTNFIELPIYNWNMQPYIEQEIFREYFNTESYRRTVNGYSGFSPPPWQDLVTQTLSTFPSPKIVSQLKQIGVNKIIVHKDEYNKLSKDDYHIKSTKVESGDLIVNELETNKQLKLEKKIGDTYIYSFK